MNEWENEDADPYLFTIPNSVRRNPNLEDGAKLFFGDLVGLARKQGYCWASNSYLADLNEVDVSTVKRWIAALLKEKLIRVKTEIDGIQRRRKIWVNRGFQKIVTKAQKRAHVGSKMSLSPYTDTSKKNTTRSRSSAPSAEASELANFLLQKIQEHKPDLKKPNLPSWAKTFDLMLKRDNRNPEKIKEVIIWATSESFWRGNILSASKLREQFDQLEIKMREKASNSAQDRLSQAEKYIHTPKVKEALRVAVNANLISVEKDHIVQLGSMAGNPILSFEDANFIYKLDKLLASIGNRMRLQPT